MTRAEKKQQTRTLILQTAMRLFAEQGILSTRMADVAAAAGVAHGSVFAHFGSQEALITAVIDHYGSWMARRTHELDDQNAGLRQILRAHMQSMAAHERFLSRLLGEMPLLPEEARDCWTNLRSAMALHFSNAAQRELDTARSLPPLAFLFNTWMGLVQYYLQNAELFAPGGSVLAQRGEELIDNYLLLLHRP